MAIRRFLTTRRSFLSIFLGLLALLAGLRALAASAAVRSFLKEWLLPRLDADSPTGTLTDGEKENVVALAEILVEGDPLPPGRRMYLTEYLDYRSSNSPGFLLLYEQASRLLDRLAGSRFSELSQVKRTQLVTAHRLFPPGGGIFDFLLPVDREKRAVRHLLAHDLIAGYYGSAAGWEIVGYEVFPGRCGDPKRYTRAE